MIPGTEGGVEGAQYVREVQAILAHYGSDVAVVADRMKA